MKFPGRSVSEECDREVYSKRRDELWEKKVEGAVGSHTGRAECFPILLTISDLFKRNETKLYKNE